MRQDMKMLRSTIENFEGLFKDIRQHLSGTPSKKRKVEEVILTELIVSFRGVQAVTTQSDFFDRRWPVVLLLYHPLQHLQALRSATQRLKMLVKTHWYRR